MGEFRTKVVGVSHTNPDGSSRQILIARYCHPGMPLIFKREPNNPVDPNTVAVWINIRFLLIFHPEVQIGYISADLAEEFAETIEASGRLQGWITDITGGTREKPIYGVNILINKEW